jgi:hypothetical protein
MLRLIRKCLRAGPHWPLVAGFALMVVVLASGIVVASPVWSQRVAFTATKVVRAAYRPAEPVDSDNGNYVAGLAKAVPGLVQHRSAN